MPSAAPAPPHSIVSLIAWRRQPSRSTLVEQVRPEPEHAICDQTPGYRSVGSTILPLGAGDALPCLLQLLGTTRVKYGTVCVSAIAPTRRRGGSLALRIGISTIAMSAKDAAERSRLHTYSARATTRSFAAASRNVFNRRRVQAGVRRPCRSTRPNSSTQSMLHGSCILGWYSPAVCLSCSAVTRSRGFPFTGATARKSAVRRREPRYVVFG